MDNLLCDEVMSPMLENDGFNDLKRHCDGDDSSFALPAIEDCEEALAIFLGNESSFMPEPTGYLKLLQTHELIPTARFKAVTFIIKTQRRMDLPVEIVFTAVNYLDRFISLEQCQGWKCWVFELLSVACLTVAAKFNGTVSNFLNEFQVNCDLENSFAPTAIQEMELKLMGALGWRMNSTTPFSYVHLIIPKIIHDHSLKQVMVEDLTQRVTELLVNALLDPKFVEFKQSVVAMSAIRCVVEEDLSESGNLLHTIIPQDQKDNVIKCLAMLEQCCWGGGPSSPVTVLKEDNDFTFCDSNVASRKRKMDSNVETKSSRKTKMDQSGCTQV